MASEKTFATIISLIIIVLVLLIAIIGIGRLSGADWAKSLPGFGKENIIKSVEFSGDFNIDNPFYISYHVSGNDADIEYFYNPSRKAILFGRKPDSQGVHSYQSEDNSIMYYRYTKEKKWEWSSNKVSWRETKDLGGQRLSDEHVRIINNLNKHTLDPNQDVSNWRWRSHAGWISVDNIIIGDIAFDRKYKEKDVSLKNKGFSRDISGKNAEDGLLQIINRVRNNDEGNSRRYIVLAKENVKLTVNFFDDKNIKKNSLEYNADDPRLENLDSLIGVINRVSKSYLIK